MIDTYTLAVEITGKVTSLQTALDSVSGKIGKASEQFSNMGRSLAPITAGVVALGYKTGKTSIDFLSLKENAQAAFTTLLGSGEKATAMMDDLYAFAKTTPFKYDTYLKSAQSLMAMGTAAEDVIPYLEGITNAAIGTGKGTEGVEQLTTAFSKMSSKGKVSLEELNMVMEAGVPAVKILANQYGVTTDEMYDMISSGELMASEVLPKLVDGMNNGTKGAAGLTAAYGGMAEAYKNTLSGSIDTMTSRFRNMSIEMWDANNAYPALIKTIQAFTNAIDLMPIIFKSVTQAATPALEALANGINKISESMKNADPNTIKRIGDIILGLAGAGAVFMGLGAGLRQVQLWSDALKWSLEGLKGTIMTIGGIPGKLKASIDATRTAAQTAIPFLKVYKQQLLLPGLSKIGGQLKTAAAGMRAFGSSAATALVPFLPLIIAAAALAGIIAYLWKTDEGFRKSITAAGAEIKASFMPVVEALSQGLADIAKAMTPVITALVGNLVPAITGFASLISKLVISLMPAVIGIINAVSTILMAIIPIITTIVQGVGAAVVKIVTLITPIITTIAGIIAKIITVITPIIAFVVGIIARIIAVIITIIAAVIDTTAKIWNAVSPVVTRIRDFIKNAFQTIGTVVRGIVGVFSSVFSRVWAIVSGVFSKIRGAWSTLTGVVGQIASGIGAAFSQLVGHIKSLVNGFIGHVNNAIGYINKIPKVNIPKIPKLAHGTNDWAGGFAVMNEGGRGEVTYLPNGAQVIPHDISVKYAKESARINAQSPEADTEAITAAVVAGISQLSGPLGDSLRKAVDGMGIEVNGREFGRVIEEYGA